MKKRRHYFIDKKFQLKFILLFSSILGVMVVGGSSALYYLLEKRLAEAMYSSHLPFMTVGEIILPILLLLNIVVSLLGVLMISGVTYLYLRKLYRHIKPLITQAQRVSQGDLKAELAYPRDKRLARFFEAFNEAIRRWQVEVLRLKMHLPDLTAAIQELERFRKRVESLPGATSDESWQEARKKFSATTEAQAKIFSELKF